MEPAVISIISVSITAIACVLAPLVSALISQRGTMKLKSFELFFQEKTAAYKEFLHACDHFLQSPSSPEEISALLEASSNALLFSSLDTQSAISAYGQLVRESVFPNCSSAKTMELSRARITTILAMQSELKDQNQIHGHKHQRHSAKKLSRRADASAIRHDTR